MEYAVAVVDATCDKKLVPSHVLDFHGKICVCISECFYEGQLTITDVETVLRNAKLKAPSL